MSGLKFDGNDAFSGAMRAAVAATESDDGEAALGHLRRAARLDPSSGLPHLLMAAELAHKRLYADAEASFATAVLLAPRLSVARFQLGLIQFTSGRVQMALLTWQPLAELGPADPLGRFVDGFGALAADDLDAARDAFQRGLALGGPNEPLNRDIARLLAEIDRLPAARRDVPTQPTSPSAASTRPPAENGSKPPTVEEHDEAARDSMHVLLAGYGRSGRLH